MRAAAGTLTTLLVLASTAVAAPPNIVLILADDLGWADLGCYGNRFIDTPNIDRLAKNGVRFTDAYAAAPVCAPTRVSILTGRHPARVGMPMLTRPHRRPWAKLIPPPNRYALPVETPSLAPELAKRGYASTLIGKWHFGYGNSPHDLDRVVMPPGHGPKTEAVAFGFLRPPGGEGASGRSFAKDNPFKGIGPQTAKAVQFIEQHRDSPFFLFLSYSMVHIPMEARPELIEKYEGRLSGRGAGIDPRYAAMVETVDDSVGIVMDRLADLELADETAVFFFSDNGGLIRVYHGAGPRVTTNAPLRGEKGTLYEGGIRVPLIASLPADFRRQAVVQTPVMSTDLFPTFLELAGVSSPAGHPADGVSLLRVLGGGEPSPRRTLFWHYPAYHHSTPASAIRLGRHKLLEFFEDGRRELYDLDDDIREARDIAAQHHELVRDLASKLDRWRTSVGAGIPVSNSDYDSDRAPVWGVRPQYPWEEAPLEALQIRRVE